MERNDNSRTRRFYENSKWKRSLKLSNQKYTFFSKKQKLLILNIYYFGSRTHKFNVLLEDFEDLEEDDLKACLLFAAKISEVKSISQLVA